MSRRPSPPALLAVAVAAALTATFAVAVPPQARADALSVQLSTTTPGANATATIETGTLTRDCDRLYTSSDLYVVPTAPPSRLNAVAPPGRSQLRKDAASPAATRGIPRSQQAGASGSPEL